MRRLVLALTALLLASTLAAAVPASAQQGADPNPAADNWVVSTYNVTFPNLTYVEVDGTLRFHKIFYDGERYSADEARDLYHLLYQRDPGRAEALVEEFEAKITERFRNAMDRIFSGANLTVTPARLDRDSLNTTREGAGEYHPPLVFHVGAEGNADLTALAGQEVEMDTVNVALQLGATLEVPFPVTAPAGTNMTLRLDVPDRLRIARAEDATVGPRNQVASIVVRNWQGGSPERQESLVAVHDPAEERFTKQQASMDVTVDVHGLDLELLDIPRGSLGVARATVQAEGAFYVLEVPANAQGLAGIDLTHVSASDLRLLVRSGLVNKSALTDLAGNFLQDVAEDAPGNVNIEVTGGIDPESLEVPVEQEVNETHPPIRLDVTANVLIDLAFNQGAGQQTAAFTLYDTSKSFTLRPVNGVATTYKIILPRGTALMDVQAQGGDVQRGTTEDGRSYFTVTAAEEPVQTTVHAGITPAFLWHQTPELVVLALIALLVPVGLVVWAVVRKRGDGDEGEGDVGNGGGAGAEP